MSHLYKKHHLRFRAKQQRKIADRLTLLAAIGGPLFTLPQAVKAFAPENGSAIALSTWIAYNVLSVVWIYYGVVHKERLIIVTQSLYMVVQTMVIVGALQHGARW